MKLQGIQPFQLVTSIMLTEGPFAGSQAVVIQPSKPFPFLRLPKVVRADIIRYVLAPGGNQDGKISITSKNSLAKSKEYNEGLKHRLGLLLVNKEVSPPLSHFLHCS